MTPFTYERVETPTGTVVQRSDGTTIPADPSNPDRQAYEAWREAGGAPAEPASPVADAVPART